MPVFPLPPPPVIISSFGGLPLPKSLGIGTFVLMMQMGKLKLLG